MSCNLINRRNNGDSHQFSTPLRGVTSTICVNLGNTTYEPVFRISMASIIDKVSASSGSTPVAMEKVLTCQFVNRELRDRPISRYNRNAVL